MYELTQMAARFTRSHPLLTRAIKFALELWVMLFILVFAIPFLAIMGGVWTIEAIDQRWQRSRSGRA